MAALVLNAVAKLRLDQTDLECPFVATFVSEPGSISRSFETFEVFLKVSLQARGHD